MILAAKDLSIGYHKECPVFGGITFSAKAGELITLIGENGSGKSTLIRTIAGLEKKLSGSLTLDGSEIDSLNAQQRAAAISLVLTERVFIDQITTAEFVALGRLPYSNWMGMYSPDDKKIVEDTMDRMKILQLKGRFYNELSDGERQKVNIARALAQQTPIILLDEPTAFLDFKAKKHLLNLLQEICQTMQKTVIVSTHDIETAVPVSSKCWLFSPEKKFLETKSNTAEILNLVG